MHARITIRPFQETDAMPVRDLFVLVNRQLAPPGGHDAFEAYIARSLIEEVGRISAYYAERPGGFWVALQDEKMVGMFGLERAAPDAMELRRMYVDPSARRGGIGGTMLRFAEAECRRSGTRRSNCIAAGDIGWCARKSPPRPATRLWAAGFAVTISRKNYEMIVPSPQPSAAARRDRCRLADAAALADMREAVAVIVASRPSRHGIPLDAFPEVDY
jgi:GNAT superfamily N-acetyltransferase